MTYYSENETYRYEAEAAWAAACEFWDEMEPEWQEMSLDPEARHNVSVDDVMDAEEYVITIDGTWTLIPGAYGDGSF